MGIFRRTVHDVDERGKLYYLINAFIGAYNRRTDVLAKVSGGSSNNLEVLNAINILSRKVDTMASNIDRIEREASDAAENVKLVRAAVDDLIGVITGLKTEVADLRLQVEQGQLDQARLDAAASMLEQADADIDAIVLPPTPTPEPAPEG